MTEPKEPINILKEPINILKEVFKVIPGGEITKPELPLIDKQKGWGKIRSTVSGTYTLQVKLPDNSVETIAIVNAIVPEGSEADIASRIYVNIINVPKEG